MPSDSYGSASWASQKDFASEGLQTFPMFMPEAVRFRSLKQKQRYLSSDTRLKTLLLGKLGDPDTLLESIHDGYSTSAGSLLFGLQKLFRAHGNNQYIGWAGEGHVLTVAPTRSGKGVGMVIPNLLHYPGSVVVCDPKGENYAITAKFRREVLKQQIVCLDPFHIVSNHTDSINPLDGLVDYRQDASTYLVQNPELLDEINIIADAMIMRGPEEKEPHWNDKCRSLLKGIILAVICGLSPSRRRHLSGVRALLVSGRMKFIDLLIDMMKNRKAAGGYLARASEEIQSMGDEELKNVISYALKHTEFLDSPLAVDALGQECDNDMGTFNLRNLKAEGGVSIYMILPPHYLARYVRLIRLWICMSMAAMTKSFDKPADGCPILFLLDEMAQLGTMEMMRQAISLLAGYGMTIWMIWQDLSQLKMLYEHDWSSFLANAKIQQFFGINDHETAKYISEMLGAATIEATSSNTGHGVSGGFAGFGGTSSRSSGTSVSEISRNLLNPDEVRRLNRSAMLMFVQGIPPILAERITYYQDNNLIQRASSNPFF